MFSSPEKYVFFLQLCWSQTTISCALNISEPIELSRKCIKYHIRRTRRAYSCTHTTRAHSHTSNNHVRTRALILYYILQIEIMLMACTGWHGPFKARLLDAAWMSYKIININGCWSVHQQAQAHLTSTRTQFACIYGHFRAYSKLSRMTRAHARFDMMRTPAHPHAAPESLAPPA